MADFLAPRPRGEAGSGQEARILRERAAALSDVLDRSAPAALAGNARMAVKIFDGGSMPTATEHYFLGHPVRFTAPAVDGGKDAGVVDLEAKVPVLVLGGVPNVGDILTAYGVGGRWVAEVAGQKPCGCIWFCNPTGSRGGAPPSSLTVTVTTYGTFKVPLVKCGNSNIAGTGCGYFLKTTVNYPGSGNCPAVPNLPFCITIGLFGGGPVVVFSWPQTALTSGFPPPPIQGPIDSSCNPNCIGGAPGIPCPYLAGGWSGCGSCGPGSGNSVWLVALKCGARPLKFTGSTDICSWGGPPPCNPCAASGPPLSAYVMWGGSCAGDGVGPPITIETSVEETDPVPLGCGCCLIGCAPCALPIKDLDAVFTFAGKEVIGPPPPNVTVPTTLFYSPLSTPGGPQAQWVSPCLQNYPYTDSYIQYILSCLGALQLNYKVFSDPGCSAQIGSGSIIPSSPAGCFLLQQDTCTPLSLVYAYNEGCGAHQAAQLLGVSLKDSSPPPPNQEQMCPSFQVYGCHLYPGLTVTVTPKGGGSGGSATTDANGEAFLSFYGVPGKYEVAVTGQDERFEAYNQEMDLGCQGGATIFLTVADGYVCGYGCNIPVSKTLTLTNSCGGGGEGTYVWDPSVPAWVNERFGGGAIGPSWGIGIGCVIYPTTLDCPPSFALEYKDYDPFCGSAGQPPPPQVLCTINVTEKV